LLVGPGAKQELIQFETDREWESLFTSEYRLRFRFWPKVCNCADKYELLPIGVVTFELDDLLVQIRFGDGACNSLVLRCLRLQEGSGACPIAIAVNGEYQQVLPGSSRRWLFCTARNDVSISASTA
jgi:hypothetical protein